MGIVTFPSSEDMQKHYNAAPIYTNPVNVPDVVVLESILSKSQCEDILEECTNYQSHTFHKCEAKTTQLPQPLPREFLFLKDVGEMVNRGYFGFDLDDDPVAWQQHYELGGNYLKHTDASPGMSRKLTAVLMLSEERDYTGGQLVIHREPMIWEMPKTQGTVVVFPAWALHEVRVITQGERYTINMGWFGPPFR